MIQNVPPFPLGMICATPGAKAALKEAGQQASEFLHRHARGDWGELDHEDWAANDEALKNGTRLLSAFTLKSNERIWVITEADRSVTTILRPDEY
jgi:hypothetical protein